MNLKLSLVIIFLTLSSSLLGQIKEHEMYRLAYNYLNDSIITSNYGGAKSLRNDCKKIVKSVKQKFEDELQVSNKFIKNNRGFPLCDLLKKKYKISESCVYAIGSDEFVLTKHVQDSLGTFWATYKMKAQEEISNSLKGLNSNRKDGYQVFFSDVFNNTIAAEVKSFCLPYDETTWFGSSTSFFFVFNEQGEFEHIYSEITIHYN